MVHGKKKFGTIALRPSFLYIAVAYTVAPPASFRSKKGNFCRECGKRDFPAVWAGQVKDSSEELLLENLSSHPRNKNPLFLLQKLAGGATVYTTIAHYILMKR